MSRLDTLPVVTTTTLPPETARQVARLVDDLHERVADLYARTRSEICEAIGHEPTWDELHEVDRYRQDAA